MRIIVIGSGLLGVASAYFLAQNGAEVTVLERAGAPAEGTSHANAGMLTPSMADPWNAPGLWWHLLRDFGRGHAPLRLRLSGLPGLLTWGPAFIRHSSTRRYRDSVQKNLRLATYSLAVLRNLRTQLGLNYDQTSAGTLRVFRDRRSLDASAARWEILAGFGLKPKTLSPGEVAALEPALAEVRDKIAGGIHCAEDESGDAQRFTGELARQAQGLGVRFQFNSEVTGFEHDGDRLMAVVTAAGRQPADVFVLAAGPWSPLLLKSLDVKLPVRPVKGYSITLDAAAWGQRPGLPVIDDTLHAAVTPMGARLRVAGLAEFAGYDRSLRAERIENLFSLLLAIYPSFAPHLDRTRAQPWAGLRPVSADGVPFIGRLRYRNLYLNTGHGHLGWTLSAGSGKLLAALIGNRPPEIDAAPYAAQR